MGKEAVQLSLWLQLAVLGGALGLFVLFVSNFCILILPYLQSFYFEVVILSGGRPGSGGQHATGVELEGGTLPALWYLANIICQIFTEIFYKISKLLEGLKQQ